MTLRILFLTGAALLLLGIGQIVQVQTATQTLLLPSCLGKSVAISVGGPGVSLMHCWGCYAALAGAALMMSAAGIRLRARKLSRAPRIA